MLKIESEHEVGRTTLRLQGNVIGLWVEELRGSCESARRVGKLVDVDLADVGFVDRAGVDLLRALEEAGVTLVNASRFVTEQLRAQPR